MVMKVTTQRTWHHRRSKGKIGTTVTFTANMIVTKQKQKFLANRQKQKFVSMLSEELEKAKCETYHTSGDGNLLIMQKAVQCVTTNNTVLIGDDTDLLVLLWYHANLGSYDLFFCSESKKNTKKPRIWNIKATKQLLSPDICKHIYIVLTCTSCI